MTTEIGNDIAQYFTPVAKLQFSKNSVMCVFGPTGTRRTSFAVGTAPEPVFYFYHRGEQWEKALGRFMNREIHYCPFGGNVPLDADVFERMRWAENEFEILQKSMAAAYRELKRRGCGTVVFDTWKTVRELLIISILGDVTASQLLKTAQERGVRVNKNLGALWGPIEIRYRELLAYPKSIDAGHTIYIERSALDYDSPLQKKPQVLSGGKEVQYAAKIIVQMDSELKTDLDPQDPTRVIVTHRYTGRIVKPEINLPAFPDPTFDLICQAVKNLEIS